MDKEMGSAKAKGMRESGKIAWQPCSYTGSTDPAMIEWLVPINWKTTTDRDSNKLLTSATQEGDADDLVVMDKADGSRQVKTEPLTATEVLANEVDEFKRNRQQVLRTFQQMEVDAKTMETRSTQVSTTSPYSGAWKEDVKKHIAKLTKTVKLLVRVCSEAIDDKAIPDLLATLKTLTKADEDIAAWAVRFGFIEEKNKAKKRRTNKTA